MLRINGRLGRIAEAVAIAGLSALATAGVDLLAEEVDAERIERRKRKKKRAKKEKKEKRAS